MENQEINPRNGDLNQSSVGRGDFSVEGPLLVTYGACFL